MQTVISRKVTYKQHLRGLTSVVAVICVFPMLPQLTTSIQGAARIHHYEMYNFFVTKAYLNAILTAFIKDIVVTQSQAVFVMCSFQILLWLNRSIGN